MTSKELLIKELETLGPLEILQIRNYIHQLKNTGKKNIAKVEEVDMEAVRKSLSKIKGSMSDFISSEREDRT